MPAMNNAAGNQGSSDNTGWWIMGILGVAAVVTGAGYVYYGREHSTSNPMSMREAQAERAKGKKWFKELSTPEKWELGDQFVLGSFDWTDWLEKKPTSAFLNGADEERMYWQDML